jgi:hypothetical protein
VTGKDRRRLNHKPNEAPPSRKLPVTINEY